MNLRCRLGYHARHPHTVIREGKMWQECARCQQPIREVLPGQVLRVVVEDAAEAQRKAFWQAVEATRTKPSGKVAQFGRPGR